MLGTIHFDMTKHVLDIVYSMTICWMALYFAPLISLVTLIKFVVIFYLRLYFVNYVSNVDEYLLFKLWHLPCKMIFIILDLHSDIYSLHGISRIRIL